MSDGSDGGIRSDWATKDFYAVLGVGKTASADEIKKAYRKLARANHPDSHPDDSAKHEKFKQVAEAYDVIGDADKRKKYDQARQLFASGGFPAGGSGYSGTVNLDDLLRERAGGGGGFGDLFGDFLGFGAGARRPQPRPARGADLETTTTIGFADALDGITVSLRIASDAACATCSGTGGKPGHQPAPVPDLRRHRLRGGVGRRRVLDERDLPGVRRSAARLRRGLPDLPRHRPGPVDAHHPGEGAGRRQGRPADPAPREGRAGGARRTRRRPLRHDQGHPRPGVRSQGRAPDDRRTHLLHARPPSALQVKVPTLGGAPVTLKIPPGTPNGRTFRVRGKGAPKADGTHGDLLATVEVQVPAHLTDDAREALEAYAAATAGTKLRAGLFERAEE